MYQYFKTLQSVADSDKRQFNSIYDLTVALAKSSNYKRDVKLKKDGTPSKFIISTYTKWDEPLVAKWLMYYKNTFIGNLCKHKSLQPYCADIIQRTFHYFFQALDLDELKYSGQVTMLFNAQLHTRIAEALHCYGTEGRIERLNENLAHSGEKDFEKVKSTMKMKNAIAYASISLNKLTEEDNIQFGEAAESCSTNPLVMTLYEQFRDKPRLTQEQFLQRYSTKTYQDYIRHCDNISYRNNIGRRLVEVMLDSKPQYDIEKEEERKLKAFAEGKEYKEPSKVKEGMLVPSRIMDYMTFNKNEIATEEMRELTKASLESAYGIIVKTVKDYLAEDGIDVDAYDWNIKSKFRFNEKQVKEEVSMCM